MLGETDTDYNVTEDSMAETAGPASRPGRPALARAQVRVPSLARRN